MSEGHYCFCSIIQWKPHKKGMWRWLLCETDEWDLNPLMLQTLWHTQRLTLLTHRVALSSFNPGDKSVLVAFHFASLFLFFFPWLLKRLSRWRGQWWRAESHKHLKEETWGRWERCKNMQMRLCFSVSIRRPERGRRKPSSAGQLQLFCSRRRCWNTLISLITLHPPAADGNISSVFSIVGSILTQFREKTVQTNLPHTYIFSRLSMSHPPRVVATIYCLYIIDLLDCAAAKSQRREGTGMN